jgi:hypothetical protein
MTIRDFILAIMAAIVFALAWSVSDTEWKLSKLNERVENIEYAK